MLIKHITFDLDGTLIETKEIHYITLNKALSRYGLPVISRDDHLKIYNGLPTSKKLELLDITGDIAEKIKKEKQALTEEEIYHSAFYNFNPLMTQLREKGYKLAIYSNAIRRSVNIMLNACCPGFEFDLVLSNQDVSNPKPNAEGYTKIASYFEIYPQDMIVIEDNKHGLNSSLDAGCLTYKTRNSADTIDIITYILTNDFGGSDD